MKEIFTVGYPRSGSTWLNRLLSDLLCAPLQPAPGMAIDYFGPPNKRRDDIVIRKIHWSKEEFDSGEHYNGTQGNDVRVIFIQRDPRDVAVSAMYYRRVQPNLISVIKTIEVGRGIMPPEEFRIYHNAGWYEHFVKEWLGNANFHLRYEDLHRNIDVLRNAIMALTDDGISYDEINAALDRQSFSKHVANYKHAMRKGIVGDWKNHFTKESGELMDDLLGEFMLDHGYIHSRGWWRNLEG